MELLDRYIKTKREIFEYFGCEDYSRDIEDSREYYWSNLGDSCIGFSEEGPSGEEDFEWTYQSEIYGGRRQAKNIFRKDDFTMVLLKSDFGDGEYYAIFDNSKETME